MTATEPASWPQPRTGSEGAALVWLDALAGGICTPEAFLSAMHDQFQEGHDEGWEVLSLLDQYYRRGKIKADVFHTLKSRLEGSALTGEEKVIASLRSQTPTTTVTVPAATTPTLHATTPTLHKKPSPAVRPAVQEVRKVREVAVGDVLRGRYQVRGVLGHGGMGTVFEAIDQYRLDLPTSGQRIAIKILHTAVSQREQLLAELQREFQHLQLLSHPNIVRVHEFDRDGENAFFTMELLSGALLSRVLGARNAIALPRPYALAVMREVGAALAHAHSRGVVHGDINPQNIFVTNNGELRVLDFGASHKLLRTAENGLSQRAPVATRGYASCQLLEGQCPDARDDLFAFACVAYVLLSGKHPFPKRTAVEARAQRVRPRRPPGLTGRQWRVLREGLRWERDRRSADVQKWLDRFDLTGAAPHLPPLAALEQAPPPRKRGALLAAAAIAVVAVLAAGGYWAVRNYDSRARLVMPVTPAATDQTPAVTDQTPPLSSARSTSAPRENPPTALGPVTSTPAATAPPPSSPATSTPAATAPPPSSPATSAPAATRSAAGSPIPAAPSPSSTAPPTQASTSHAAAATAPATAGSEATSRAANAGPARIEMAADTVDVDTTDQPARVMVRRKGSLRGDASFTWWTESGTAKPGRDFLPVIPRGEHIADGSGSVSLSIPILSTPRDKPRSFYVVIDRTESGGAALGARTLTMVTIQPPN